MNVEYQISSSRSHAVCAVVALVATAVLMWLVFTVAGDYYVADEHVAAATQTVETHQAGTVPAPMFEH